MMEPDAKPVLAADRGLVEGALPVRKVLYIAGWGRSGTTILDNILGEIDGFFSAGEVTYLWSRGLLRGFRCGCGAPLRDCEIWGRVLEYPFEGGRIGDLDPKKVCSWQQRDLRIRHTWRVLREARTASMSSSVGRYRKLLEAVYSAIAEVTGARVIVDSSKRPSDAALLPSLRTIEPHLLHMVRDPRAVAYSWQRRKMQPGFREPREMVIHSAWGSTAHWMTWNAAASAVRRRMPSSMQLRYEELVAAPRRTINSITEMVGENRRSLPFIDDATVVLGDNHTVSGNPSRFERGQISIRSDDEWITNQRRTDRWLTSTMALPRLGHYGYRLHAATITKGGNR